MIQGLRFQFLWPLLIQISNREQWVLPCQLLSLRRNHEERQRPRQLRLRSQSRSSPFTGASAHTGHSARCANTTALLKQRRGTAPAHRICSACVKLLGNMEEQFIARCLQQLEGVQLGIFSPSDHAASGRFSALTLPQWLIVSRSVCTVSRRERPRSSKNLRNGNSPWNGLVWAREWWADLTALSGPVCFPAKGLCLTQRLCFSLSPRTRWSNEIIPRLFSSFQHQQEAQYVFLHFYWRLSSKSKQKPGCASVLILYS